MLQDHITSLITKNLGYTPTSGQDSIIIKLADFLSQDSLTDALLIKGYAGTGKTTLMSALVKSFVELKVKSVLLAPTGRAAKVLSSYTGRNAYTIHKKIYRQKSSGDGFGVFELDKNLHSYTYFIVDEASMLSNQALDSSIFGSGRLLDDLIEYVFTGTKCRLILVGDTAQLPPVGLDISAALKKKVLEDYLITVEEYTLTEIVRQALGSGILSNATEVRNMINERMAQFPKFQLEGFEDIRKLGGQDLIETISGCYDKYGIRDTLVVTRSNKRANRFNQGIRNSILWREEEIAVGDYIMTVKNNYFWLPENDKIDFIANGDILEIVKIYRYQELYGYRFADVCVKLIDVDELEFDAKIILDTLNIESASLTQTDNKNLFFAIAEDYPEITQKRKRFKKIRENEYYNALQVKFAYAVTCHKAQGGQWKAVFVDQGYITDDMINVEYLRWLYTALTRATEKLYLVNFRKEFFNPDANEDF